MFEAAIVIPHYNDCDRLIRCLEALMPQLVPEVELILVDNASTEDLSRLHQRWPDLRIVTEHKKGAAEARNRGVLETTAPLLFFLDCDCVPEDDWLATARAVAKRGDVIGGSISVFDETPPPRSGSEAFETVFAFHNRRYVEEENFSVTANLLTRRDVFEATGPFIAGLSEDLDWCHRATANGYTLRYEDSLRVAHPSRKDWTALRRKWKRMTEEKFGVNGSGALARVKWLALALLMPASAVAHTPRVLRNSRLRDPQERAAALFTLFRLRFQRMIWMIGQALTGRP
ncbi:glycosyltransferase family 2 protein [Phycobacter sp. K97]|uniref:glycosyltransferase family 2 protein n=1 Tax=Phycobacter sedimenti TaxID=3133977 RepID=UPI0031202F86